ncbi:MAG TPA: multiheme c-type cytochrome [Chitinophagaceae bacterium]|nr:multiheme c-type cytochrome [Chitinophagaceae bacterium]
MDNRLSAILKQKQAQVIMIILLVIVGSNLFFTPKKETEIPYGTKMVGSQACRSCHANIYDSHIQTAHFKDSRPAEGQYIKGSFEAGSNFFNYNQFMSVELRKEGDRFVQAGMVGGTEMQKAFFDIVIGSGRKGQTYLFWQGNNLFQLPVSYYTETNSWCNSPGFPNVFKFNRPIPLNCLECHATYAKSNGVNDGKENYEPSSIIYGIDCERCHGGGADHVSWHLEHKEDKIGRYIVNTAKMERQVRVDGCALCHSGFRKAIQPPFNFQFGDTLAKFSTGSPISNKADTLDVHGNQYGLMAASKCYIKSATMDCSSCHNVHRNEYNDPKLYSTRCMTCHGDKEAVHCSFKPTAGMVLEDNCIDCHMPVLSSNKIRLDVNGKQTQLPDRIRTHYISIYKNLKKG